MYIQKLFLTFITISVHNMFCKKKSFWQRCTCTSEETAPSPPPVEVLSDQEYDQLLDCHPDTNKSVLSNEETSHKSKKKKSKAENTDKMDTDSNSDDIEEQRKKLITSVLDSSILNDSTASSSSGKKNKKKKRKEAEKVNLVF